MSESFKPFDAASATLHRGVNVVEASAGTGKTYAIAMLVLRFVVEHNVPVEELLVVSYTKAATEELRSRIRARLLEARDILTASEKKCDDRAFLQYIKTLPDAPLALKRLELALLDMDRAAIFTIHSFCQRMLQEQALESGQFFDMELTADVSKIQDELVFDFWRSTLYDLSAFHCSLFLSHFSNPNALFKSVKGVAVEDSIQPADRISPEQALELVDEAMAVLTQWWQKKSQELELNFQEALEKKMFKKVFVESFDSWWHQCGLFFSGASQHLPPNISWLGSEGLLELLNGTKLRGDVKKRRFLQDFPLADEIIGTFLAACEQAVLALRIHLALELQTGLRKRLLAQGCFSFDDLVLSLANALQDRKQNELQRILATRFQVALIDEFQDTDAAQYRIFSTLFGGREKKHFLYLIGDPKQAIYKFRGADIYAYFQARKSADFHLGLEKNYRSNPHLVTAVNNLFLQKTDAFVRRELPYIKVSAAKDPDYLQFCQNGQSRAAMVYCSLESPHEDGIKAWTSGKCRTRILSYVVREIQELLKTGSLLTDTGEKKRVRAGDIAILARTNKQAEEFQEALAYAAIPSVVSSRKTVFETRECFDLLQVLEAVALPSDIRLLRTAMSCKWFGMNGQTFYRETRDSFRMDAWMERFHEYHRLWLEKGFLAMMNKLFARESVFETLCNLPLAERGLTNLMHLTEIVQEVEARENLSCAHVLQYLSAQMESGKAGEHAELRLESDEDAVKVVTMHAVKGLEYPIVFCPYLWHRSGWLQKEKYCITYHDGENNQVADLGSADFDARREVALQEELAEEVRLLYVAVTRASSRCYVFWADVSGSGSVAHSRKSALAWILSLADCNGIQEQTEQFVTLCDDKSVEVRSVAAQDDEQERLSSRVSEKSQLSCRTFSRSLLPAEWLMTSYSALAAPGYATPHGSDSSIEMRQKKMRKIYDLPLGAAFGNVVHGLLEDFSFTMLAGVDDYEEECLAQGRRFGVVAKSDQLMNMLRDVTRTPLKGIRDKELFALADLDEKDVVKEMPFYFHLREESTKQINRLLGFSDVVQPIQEKQLKGFLTGFIDLVCRHRGKYYIMDYKTNYLGDYLDEYTKDNLVTAMHDHNYGLQYWIYTMVLHRFLLATLPDYTYEQDFGGVFYLFARGMSPRHPGNGVYFDRPDISVLDELYGSLGAE